MGEGMGTRVLYVEDEAPLRELVTDVLEEHGYFVRTAASAEDGLACLLCGKVDVLLTDYSLPLNNGDWLVREAASRGVVPPGGVVLVTAELSPCVDAEGVGEVPVLQKPVDLDALLETLSARAG